MKKMYYTTPIKTDKIVIKLEKKKPRTYIPSVRSSQYSFYEKATRRANNKLKKELKNFY